MKRLTVSMSHDPLHVSEACSLAPRYGTNPEMVVQMTAQASLVPQGPLGCLSCCQVVQHLLQAMKLTDSIHLLSDVTRSTKSFMSHETQTL